MNRSEGNKRPGDTGTRTRTRSAPMPPVPLGPGLWPGVPHTTTQQPTYRAKLLYCFPSPRRHSASFTFRPIDGGPRGDTTSGSFSSISMTIFDFLGGILVCETTVPGLPM